LKEYGMRVRKKKKSVTTTNSRHRFRKYPNLIKEVKISQAEQVWVADITYMRTNGGFNYLHLITDAYSKRIVGFELSNNLKAKSTIRALKGRMYPDRDLQYCSDNYVQILTDK
jgi:transposase InsO family protein